MASIWNFRSVCFFFVSISLTLFPSFCSFRFRIATNDTTNQKESCSPYILFLVSCECRFHRRPLVYHFRVSLPKFCEHNSTLSSFSSTFGCDPLSRLCQWKRPYFWGRYIARNVALMYSKWAWRAYQMLGKIHPKLKTITQRNVSQLAPHHFIFPFVVSRKYFFLGFVACLGMILAFVYDMFLIL